MKNILPNRVALVLLMLITVAACAKPAPAPSPAPTPTAPASPAEFEVVFLDVTPTEVMSGETVTVKAEVKNTGDSKGTYTAILTVGGVEVEKKNISIATGAIETVTFSLTVDKAGIHKIAIGDLSSSLTVKEKLVAKEVEFKYDHGKPRRGYLSSSGGGYLVDFSPPVIPFTIKQVRVLGGLCGSGWEGKNFRVEIWDREQRALHSAIYPVTKFAVAPPFTWIDIEIPDIEVTGKFYVHLYTGTRVKPGGIFIGVDSSIVNEHSNVTIRTAEGFEIRPDWPWATDTQWFSDKSKVNWMIRVIGTIMVPASSSTLAPSPTPTPTPTETTVVQINTAHGTERELETKAALEMLLVEYDVSKLIFTKSVLIEEGVIPHSHPVLTIHTRHLNDKPMLLSTFIHEQIHWFLSARDAKVNQAIDELQLLYPEVPVGGSEGAKTEHSTYLHLIVNYLEFSAMEKLIGQESAVSLLERMDHYTWIYETVLPESDKIEEIVRKYGLLIE